jgi:uncharacterized membrane protein YfcA|tara:strand:+ start:3894 stop:4331 length:438 start_codon:yes stop_codon:yes gene_type:complete
MFGLPLEVITMIVSTLGGAFLKLMAQSQQDRAEQFKMATQRFKASEDSISNARKFQNPNANWIRRFLVISFMSMAGFILLAPLLGQTTTVPVEVTTGFKFLFLDLSNTVTEYINLEGIVVPDWLSHAIMSVVGMYFGQSVVQRRS